MNYFLILLLSAVSFLCGHQFEAHLQLTTAVMSVALIVIIAHAVNRSELHRKDADLNSRLLQQMSAIEALVQENKTKTRGLLAELDAQKREIARMDCVIKKRKMKL